MSYREDSDNPWEDFYEVSSSEDIEYDNLEKWEELDVEEYDHKVFLPYDEDLENLEFIVAESSAVKDLLENR